MIDPIIVKDLKFLTGKFKKPILVSKNDIEIWISTIKNFPESIKSLNENLIFEKLNWVYRPNGWSIKHVIHHIAHIKQAIVNNYKF